MIAFVEQAIKDAATKDRAMILRTILLRFRVKIPMIIPKGYNVVPKRGGKQLIRYALFWLAFFSVAVF